MTQTYTTSTKEVQANNSKWWVHHILQCRLTRVSSMAWKPVPMVSVGSTLSTRIWQRVPDAAAATGTDQTGSGCLGWLMSPDIYCHWVGWCILQGTAAFPIGQLHLNGYQTFNKARMPERWMQWESQQDPFSPWELSLYFRWMQTDRSSNELVMRRLRIFCEFCSPLQRSGCIYPMFASLVIGQRVIILRKQTIDFERRITGLGGMLGITASLKLHNAFSTACSMFPCTTCKAAWLHALQFYLNMQTHSHTSSRKRQQEASVCVEEGWFASVMSNVTGTTSSRIDHSPRLASFH